MQPVRCRTMGVTAGFLPLLGIKASLGRLFTAEEEAKRTSSVLISSELWRSHYSSDPNIIGKTVRITTMQYTIVGVLPPFMDDPALFGAKISFWLLDPTSVNRQLREGGWYQIAARLKPRISIEKANSEMGLIAQRLSHEYPKTNLRRGFAVVPYPTSQVPDLFRSLVWLTMGLSSVVLLIACANLAGLQLVRVAAKSGDMFIRLALGCGRARLIKALLAESLVLSLAGGVLGVLVAMWSNRYLSTYLQIDLPIDFRVIAFTGGASVLAGTLFGLVSSVGLIRTDTTGWLKPGSRYATANRASHRLRRSLIVGEIAMSLILLAAAGYFVRGIGRLTNREMGWDPEHVLVGILSLDHDRYGEWADPRSAAFGQHFRADLGAIPGVSEVSVSTTSPAQGLWTEQFKTEGSNGAGAGSEVLGYLDNVSPGYLKVYGLTLLRGRDFAEGDRAGAPNVVIISKSMAERLWPGESALGKRIDFSIDAFGHIAWSEVVGVIADFSASGPLQPTLTRFTVLRPWAQSSNRYFTVSIRTLGNPEMTEGEVRRVLARLQPNIAFSELRTANEAMSAQLSTFQLIQRSLLAISGFGLLLAGVGVYGVIANLASERTREVGIRIALGAQSVDVASLFLKDGMLLTLIGTAVGTLGAIGIVSFLRHAVAIIPGGDPLVIVCVVILLASISLLAALVPALNATRIQPVESLRN